jgi:hypothetical protein
MPHTKGFKIISNCCYYLSWGYLRLVALMLGANKLLAMAKDTGGLCPIVIGEVFF